jgi:hypothetical protein
MKNNFLIKSIKKNSIFILFLIVIIFLIFIFYKYNSLEQFTEVQPQCFSRLDDCNLDIVLVIGQSNANGPNVRNNDPNITNSYTTDPTYSDDLNYVINPNIFRVKLVFDNMTKLLVNPQPARICEAQESGSSFSTDVSFAREYLARTGRKVLIINASRSSTSILTSTNNSRYIWQKNNLNGKIQFYTPVKDFVNLVKTKICSSSKLVAIIYRGSEEDSYRIPKGRDTCGSTGVYDSTYIRTFNTKFSELLNSFKTDIGDSSTKILVSGLMLNDTKKCMTYFSINVLRALSRQNGYTFVDTDRVSNNKVRNIKYFQRKLTANGGNTEVGSGVHFDKLSNIELGKRLAYAYFDPNYNVG